MSPFPFYRGLPGASRPGGADRLPTSHRAEQVRPDGYLADPGLTDAVNVALMLGQPLLLTGEPGTGKTQLAYSLAHELGLGTPLTFETKSTSTAGDLFYTYNALARFHAAQSGEGSRRALDYITYNALGIAILRASSAESVAALVPDGVVQGAAPRRSVVLIDEIDKAPRDFPNDILNEVEGMFFRIPELGNALVAADPSLQPILVITSNSEKNLPDAFLRRCVYYHIPFPDRERLASIVAARLDHPNLKRGPFLDEALDLLSLLRDPATGLRKRPATAELLGWLSALRGLAPDDENPLASDPELAERTLGALVKAAEDQELARATLQRWRKARER
jgi:MoxR-like ATPase